jgi:tetratricopeptide (TPR) repeat protein
MLIERKIIFFGEGCWQVAPGVNLSSIGVPETLQGLILARFDRLSLFQRRLLQTASVVGYQFSPLVLSQVLLTQVDCPSRAGISEALDDLTEREFILPLGAAAGDEDTGYQFRHALVSDAVYSTLLQRDRRDLHSRVGEAIETIFAGRLDGYIEVLASHFLRSPHLDRALRYLILSGEKAARSYANDQSLQLFRQALELLPGAEHTEEQAMKVHNGLGDALVTAGDYSDAREHYISAMEALGVPGRTGALQNFPQFPEQQNVHGAERIRLLSQLQRKIAKTLESLGEYDKALVYLKSAQSVLRFAPEGFAAEQASSLNDTGWIFFRRGSLDQAENVLLEGLSIAEQSGQKDVTASILNRLAGIYYQRDAVDQASFTMQRSLLLREEIGDVVAVARSYNNLGLLSWKQGLLQEALKDFNRSFQLQSNLGDVEGQIVLHTNMGLIEMDRGNLQESQEHFQEALDTARQIGHFYHVCLAQMHLALLNVYAGNWPAALEYGQLSLAGFQELGVTENLIHLNVSLGWAYLGLGDEAHCSEIRRRLLALLDADSSSSGASEGHGRAYCLLARFDRQLGDLAGARENLEKSAEIFAQSNSPLERSRSLVELGNLLAATGQTDRAKSLFAEARQVFDRMGARLELDRLQRNEQNLG